jgi:membrane-bound serine protease (ClpP class)
MRKHPLAYLWLCLLLMGLLAFPGAAQVEKEYAVLSVRGAIDPVVAQYVQRGIRTAVDSGAQFVILELDTPGGLDSSMREIIKTILAAPLPVIAYVAPNGARAASAGLFIVYACPLAAMAPSTNIGAAHPVAANAQELSSTLNEKAVNDAVAYIRALAGEQGHNADWAEEAIRKSVSITAAEALERGVINLIAVDRNDLLRQLHGREVKSRQGVVKLDTMGIRADELGMNPQETLLHVIVDPTIAYLLLTIGIWGLIIEFSAPGISAGGIIGIVCLVLFGVSVASLPLNWAGLALIGFSIVLFILEINTPTNGFLTLAGIAVFLLGSLLLFNPFTPRAPGAMWPMELSYVSRWVIGGVTALTAGLFFVAVSLGIRAQRLAPTVGAERLIGALGIAQSDCDLPGQPMGTVHVNGEIWSAVSEEEHIPAGAQVQVVARDGLVLRVKKVAS